MKTIGQIVFGLIFSFSFYGCGVYSFSGASIPPDTETVTIQYFNNYATQVAPLLSQRFTELMEEKFVNDTSLQQARSNGDLEFSGFIKDYYVEPVASGGNQQARLNRLTIGVKVDYVNRKTEEEWTQVFTRFSDFEQNQTLNAVEDELIEEISKQIVDDVFNKALVNW